MRYLKIFLILFQWIGLLVVVGCGDDAKSTADGGVDTDSTDDLGDSPLTAVWANSGEDKVAREELRATTDPSGVINAVWNGSQISVAGARNEVVAFNLVLEAGEGAVGDVSVTFDVLNGPNNNLISGRQTSGDGVFDWTDRHIELFYVRYLQIRGLSDVSYNIYDERHVPEKFRRPWSGEGVADPGTGWADRPHADMAYPEIAVPLELVTSFTIPRDMNQSIWCDIYIPKTAAPGLYSGQITVAQQGVTVHQIPVTLKVHGFTLPDTPAVKTMIYLSRSNIDRRHLGEEYPNDPNLVAQSLLITNRYFQLAHRHKLSLIAIEGAARETPSAEWTSRLDGSLFSAANQYDGPGNGVGLNVFSIGTYGSWTWQDEGQAGMQSHANGWVNWFESNHPDVEYFLYLIDESTDYAEIEQWANWVETTPGPGSELLTLATMRIAASSNCPSLDIPATVSGLRTPPDEWEQVSLQYRDASDKRLFMYNGVRPMIGSFATEDDGVSLRATSWIQYKLGVERWFFWSANYWRDNWFGGETNVFQQARTFGEFTEMDDIQGEDGNSYSNGDGVLVYPGTDQLYPDDSYGANGPIGGLRMKHWRRGIQDGDYLALAEAIDPAAVRQIINERVPKGLWEYGVNDVNDPTWVLSDISWTNDPDAWEQSRAALAALIENGGFFAEE